MLRALRLTRRRIRVLALIIALFGGVAFLLTSLGWYPIMSVNGDLVTARRFWTHLHAAKQYDLSRASSTTTTPPGTTDNLTLKVLNGLVEERLIHHAAQEEFGARLSGLIREQEKTYEANPKVFDEGKRIYGLNAGQFLREILYPQIERDLFVGRLYLQSVRLEDWMRKAKQEAKVSIFSGNVMWDGDEMQFKTK